MLLYKKSKAVFISPVNVDMNFAKNVINLGVRDIFVNFLLLMKYKQMDVIGV